MCQERSQPLLARSASAGRDSINREVTRMISIFEVFAGLCMLAGAWSWV
jgi:hypothetical protein